VIVSFLAGLALTPSRLRVPMIPINLAIIGAGAQAGSRARILPWGRVRSPRWRLSRCAGPHCDSYSGTFGEINASPWFQRGYRRRCLSLLGLAMFDVLLIDFSSYSSWFRAGARSVERCCSRLTMGAGRSVLAGACVARSDAGGFVFEQPLAPPGTRLRLALPFCWCGDGHSRPIPARDSLSLPKPESVDEPHQIRLRRADPCDCCVTNGYTAYDLFPPVG